MGNPEPRPYKSHLREQRAAQTKQGIVDAVFEVMGAGGVELTMPAVAKAAGVSLPTVYRYFPDKRTLLDAAADEARERLGVRKDPAPSLAAFLQRIRDVGSRLRNDDNVLRILGAVTLEGPYPAEAQAERREGVAAALREQLRGIKGRERQLAIDWVMMLGSSPTVGVLTRFNFEDDERTERLVWAIETLLLGVQARRERGMSSKEPGTTKRKGDGT